MYSSVDGNIDEILIKNTEVLLYDREEQIKL
jgi:hypothetical protein